MVNEKRFAYIGESDHFIHEKYAYRLLMLKYLAGRGFTHVGEEIGASDGMRIDRFIGHRRRIAARTHRRLWLFRRDSDRSRRHSDRHPARQLSETAYPTAQFAAEQKRFAHGLREIGVRLESSERGSRLHFFGFDIDPLPGGGYEDLAEILESMPADATIDRIRNALQRVTGRNNRRRNRAARRGAEIDRSARSLASRTRCATPRPACATVSITSASRIRRRPLMRSIRGWLFASATCIGRSTVMLGQMRANEKLALMSHNMHLCRAPDAVAGSDAAAGPGGKTDPPLGAWLAARYPAEVFSVWMLIGRGRDSQPFPTLSKEIREKAGTLNATARRDRRLVSYCRSTEPTRARAF